MSSPSYRGATLLDTDPLVAWFDRSDQDHGSCAAFFQKHNSAFVSTWPVLTEVCHLIPAEVAPRFLSWVSLGGLNVAELSGSALKLMAGWMRK
jgi:predicted nucleic acid-binding protein